MNINSEFTDTFPTHLLMSQGYTRTTHHQQPGRWWLLILQRLSQVPFRWLIGYPVHLEVPLKGFPRPLFRSGLVWWFGLLSDRCVLSNLNRLFWSPNHTTDFVICQGVKPSGFLMVGLTLSAPDLWLPVYSGHQMVGCPHFSWVPHPSVVPTLTRIDWFVNP